MLCKTCRKFFRRPGPYKHANDHSHLLQIQRSAAINCYICQILCRAILDPSPSHFLNSKAFCQAGEAVDTTVVSRYQIRHNQIWAPGRLELIFELKIKGLHNSHTVHSTHANFGLTNVNGILDLLSNASLVH